MTNETRRALERGHLIDITTTGRRSGEARRIELGFQNIDGRVYISGMPRPGRKRAWIHNLEQDPRMTFHLKGPIASADLPATARVIDDPGERREILARFAAAWGRSDLDGMVEHSPLIEVAFDSGAADTAAAAADEAAA